MRFRGNSVDCVWCLIELSDPTEMLAQTRKLVVLIYSINLFLVKKNVFNKELRARVSQVVLS